MYFYETLQYKDAFLSANPDFKWYKLPAPPLRLATVRSNSECEIRNGSQHGENASPTSPKALNDFGQTDTGNRLQNENRNLFKLADETQMGGLNSLMMAAEMVNGKHINNNDKYHDNNMTSDLEVTAEEDNGNYHLKFLRKGQVPYLDHILKPRFRMYPL